MLDLASLNNSFMIDYSIGFIL